MGNERRRKTTEKYARFCEDLRARPWWLRTTFLEGSHAHARVIVMDLSGALRAYLDRLLTEQTGMKALLLDSFASKVVSLVYSQHELLKKEVFLTDLLEHENRRAKPFLKAVVIARPTAANLRHLKRELRNPLFASFSVYWTSKCSDENLRMLAELDTHDRVTAVHEYYLDYFALDSVSFSAGAPAGASTCLNIPQVNWGEAETAAFERCVDSK